VATGDNHKAAITGVSSTRVGELPGSDCLALHAEAALAAVTDAGLTMRDVDGLLCAYSLTQPHIMLASAVAEYLGLQVRYATAVSMGGVTAASLMMHAAMLVETGACRHVLVVTGDNRRTGLGREAVAMLSNTGAHPDYERPYGLTIPAAYAIIAQRYMHDYGLGPEHLAALAVTQRAHAALHPLAHLRTPLTLEEALATRLIASPLRLSDCCLISDGGAAAVVSAPSAGADSPRPVVRILGAGQGHTHEYLVGAPSLTQFGCKGSSSEAFGRAGVTARDMDLVEIYDSFTITLTVELESMGFFDKGEAGVAALAGELAIGGRLPCNTHGGLLAYGHSGAAGGMFHVVEAVQQLRCEAAARQVRDARLALVHGDGGVLAAHCSLVFGRM
jgi:acetyl-CoA acetyltransferase